MRPTPLRSAPPDRPPRLAPRDAIDGERYPLHFRLIGDGRQSSDFDMGGYAVHIVVQNLDLGNVAGQGRQGDVATTVVEQYGGVARIVGQDQGSARPASMPLVGPLLWQCTGCTHDVQCKCGFPEALCPGTLPAPHTKRGG